LETNLAQYLKYLEGSKKYPDKFIDIFDSFLKEKQAELSNRSAFEFYICWEYFG